MSAKPFKFTVENTRTGEKTSFIGDGLSISEAIKDGLKNVDSAFRPKGGSPNQHNHNLAVQTQYGIKTRSLAEFESDFPYEVQDF